MNELLTRLLKRMKKFAVLLLLIPILTAGAGYFFASQGTSTTYTASSKIILGNFENTKHTSPTVMKEHVKTTKFLEKLNKEFNLDLDVDKVKSGLNVNADPQVNSLELIFNGTDKEEVKKTLKDLTDGIIAEGNVIYEEKMALLENEIKSLEKRETDRKEVDLVDLKIKKIDMDNSEIVEEVSVAPVTTGVSPKKSAILGLLVGFILNFFILALPELFREEK